MVFLPIFSTLPEYEYDTLPFVLTSRPVMYTVLAGTVLEYLPVGYRITRYVM